MVRSIEGGNAGSVARVSPDRGASYVTSHPGVNEALGMLGNGPLNFSLKHRLAGNEEVAWVLPVSALAVLILGAPLTQAINPQRCGSRAPLSDHPCTHNEPVTHTQHSLRRLEADRSN